MHLVQWTSNQRQSGSWRHEVCFISSVGSILRHPATSGLCSCIARSVFTFSGPFASGFHGHNTEIDHVSLLSCGGKEVGPDEL